MVVSPPIIAYIAIESLLERIWDYIVATTSHNSVGFATFFIVKFRNTKFGKIIVQEANNKKK